MGTADTNDYGFQKPEDDRPAVVQSPTEVRPSQDRRVHEEGVRADRRRLELTDWYCQEIKRRLGDYLKSPDMPGRRESLMVLLADYAGALQQGHIDNAGYRFN